MKYFNKAQIIGTILSIVVSTSIFAQDITTISKGGKEITSTISSSTNVYIPGTTFDLPIVYEHNSPDDEYTAGIIMTFPSGVTVNSAEDAGSGVTPESWNGETGDGVTTTWGTTDGSSTFGSISADDIWNVNITVDASFSGDLTIDYTVVGDNYGADPHSVSGSFTISEAIASDLAVTAVSPLYVFPGNSATPIVTVLNNGVDSQDTFDLQVIISNETSEVYNSTKQITSAALTGLQSADITMDEEWTTPADGEYTITAIVTLTDDSNSTNDQITSNCHVGEYYEVQAGNTFSGDYGFIDLTNGDFTATGTIGSTIQPTAEEFDGNHIYRIYSDSTFGTVNAFGEFTFIGTFSGVAGTPTALAFDHSTETMYVCMMSDTGIPQLCTANMTDGTLTLIGNGIEASIIGMDFANDGLLYGPALNDSLYQINTSTGELIPIGAVGINLQYGQDVSFDYSDNRLYTITCGDLINGGLVAFGYYDLSTGAFVSITEFELTQFSTFVITNMPTATSNEAIEESTTINIYPNPSLGKINIASKEKSIMTLMDMSGKVINVFEVNAFEKISINLNSGMYVLRIEDEKETTTRKIIIQ